MTSVNEVWFLYDEVVYEGPCSAEIVFPDSGNFNYAFFERMTGEVWGRRILIGPPRPWIYSAQPFPNLLLPFEIERNYMPPQYFDAIMRYLPQWTSMKETPLLSSI